MFLCVAKCYITVFIYILRLQKQLWRTAAISKITDDVSTLKKKKVYPESFLDSGYSQSFDQWKIEYNMNYKPTPIEYKHKMYKIIYFWVLKFVTKIFLNLTRRLSETKNLI